MGLLIIKNGTSEVAKESYSYTYTKYIQRNWQGEES